VSAAREFGAGVVIACDLDLDKQYRLDYQAFPSNWELVKDRHITRRKWFRVPGLPSIVFQAMELSRFRGYDPGQSGMVRCRLFPRYCIHFLQQQCQ
jgi:hypothetical protein